ncbi:DUF456 domain-containing protein [Syntrophomonas wolfei]|uniref:DUF456 domain-containing protein n=1 Tax=Syntrophomonas wolfei TaxID=863 RepID=UPI0007747052|nr:DUF456 domain-containing protein [Syntrophomonas wolfei]
MESSIMALIIVMILLLLGIGGTILPLLPGIPLMFVSIAAYGWYEGFNTITPKYVCILAALTVISLIVDYLSTVLGAKYFGSSKKGMWGALLGTFIGLFLFPPLGLLLGPFLGAMIGEYIEIQDVEKAVKIGVGTVVGLFSGMVFKLVLAIGMFVSFLIVVF